MADFDWGNVASFLAGGPVGAGIYAAGKGLYSLSKSDAFDMSDPVGSVMKNYNEFNSAQAGNKVAYTKTGLPYDRTNADSMINALAQEYANKRDDTSYTRLIQQLKANGINPALALSNNASPISSDAGTKSGYSLNSKDQMNSALKVGSLLVILLKLLSM